MPAATERRRGYQVVAQSPGVSEGMLAQMDAYMLPAGVDRRFSRSKALLRLRGGLVAYSNIINAGEGYDGRPGALYNHTLILSNESFAEIDFDTRVLDAYFVRDPPLGALPSIPVLGSSPASEINRDCRHLALPVLRAVFSKQRAAVSGLDDPSFLPNVLAALPPSMRTVPFSTCLPYPSKQPAYRLATYSGRMHSVPDGFVRLDPSSKGSVGDELDDAIAFLIKRASSAGRLELFSEFERIPSATPRAKIIMLSKIFGVSSGPSGGRARRAEDASEALMKFDADTQSRLMRNIEPVQDPKKTPHPELAGQEITAGLIEKMMDGVPEANKRRVLKAMYGARRPEFEKSAGRLLADTCDSPHAPDVYGFFAATPDLHPSMLKFLFGKSRGARRRRAQALAVAAALKENPELMHEILARGAYGKHSKDDARDLRGILEAFAGSERSGADQAPVAGRPEPRSSVQSAGGPRRQPARRFRDPIHGFIDVYGSEMSVIQDPVFQRLRRIKQLSFAHLVYHGAEHSRFGHVLGTMHLAGRALRSIKANAEKSGVRIDVDDEDVRTARMAALLHDVGHRPFSHALDQIFGESHEDLSEALVLGRFAPMIEGVGPDGVDPKRVADLIQHRLDDQKPFLAELISGQLDVDKMDYLLRDSHYAGVKYGMFDLDMLVDSLVLAENKLAVSSKGMMAAEQMIIARYHMFGQVYHHKTKRAFENMAKEVAGRLFCGDLQYPSAKSLSDEADDLVELDDAWMMKEIASYKGRDLAGVVKDTLARKPFEEVLNSDTLLTESESSEKGIGCFVAVQKYVGANLESIGLGPHDVMVDRSSILPYRLLPYHHEPDADLNTDRVLISYPESESGVPIEQRSEMVKSIAREFPVHRMFVRKAKASRLRKHLDKTHPGTRGSG